MASQLYAIEIQKSQLGLIAFLNNGVEPKIEKKRTFFIFDATHNTEMFNEIMDYRAMISKYDIGRSPFLLSLKEAKS